MLTSLSKRKDLMKFFIKWSNHVRKPKFNIPARVTYIFGKTDGKRVPKCRKKYFSFSSVVTRYALMAETEQTCPRNRVVLPVCGNDKFIVRKTCQAWSSEIGKLLYSFICSFRVSFNILKIHYSPEQTIEPVVIWLRISRVAVYFSDCSGIIKRSLKDWTGMHSNIYGKR